MDLDPQPKFVAIDEQANDNMAVSTGRIILTSNVKDFRPLMQEDSPGVIGIPETWTPSRLDTKLTALLTTHGSNYFRGRIRSLSAEDVNA